MEFKGTVNAISTVPPWANIAMTDSQRYHEHLYLIISVEVIFLEYLMFFCSRNAQVTFVWKPQFKIISFKIINVDKAFKVP